MVVRRHTVPAFPTGYRARIGPYQGRSTSIRARARPSGSEHAHCTGQWALSSHPDLQLQQRRGRRRGYSYSLAHTSVEQTELSRSVPYRPDAAHNGAVPERTVRLLRRPSPLYPHLLPAVLHARQERGIPRRGLPHPWPPVRHRAQLRLGDALASAGEEAVGRLDAVRCAALLGGALLRARAGCSGDRLAASRGAAGQAAAGGAAAAAGEHRTGVTGETAKGERDGRRRTSRESGRQPHAGVVSCVFGLGMLSLSSLSSSSLFVRRSCGPRRPRYPVTKYKCPVLSPCTASIRLQDPRGYHTVLTPPSNTNDVSSSRSLANDEKPVSLMIAREGA